MTDIIKELKELIDSVDKTNFNKIYPLLLQLKKYFSSFKTKFEETKNRFKSKLELQPSEEQKVIINAINLNSNISVDAVAGSGKTTTLIFIAKEFPQKKILQITYNKQLKFEVRNRAEKEGVESNLKIHTYHSLAVRYYYDKANVDQGIIKLLKDKMKIRKKDMYDIIVIDESQDMTPLFYELIQKFLVDINFSNSGLIIMGDRFQGIYDFKNADIRFLTLSDRIYSGRFVNLPLKESYRLTKNIATFVNNVMLGNERIKSNKESSYKVIYCKLNIFTVHCMMVRWIKEFLNKGFKPDDIFILAPTIKASDNPVKRLENELVKENIAVYYSRNDDDGLDEEIIKNKIVFTTFHQSKGRERKIVIVYGFDNSYFKYFKRNNDPNYCPSELYVATTRAKEILILLDNEAELPLPFLRLDYNQMKMTNYINFVGTNRNVNSVKVNEKTNEKYHNITITELVRYISEDTMKYLIPLIEDIFEELDNQKSKNTVEIPTSIRMESGLTEDISNLNGLVIPQLYEQTIKNDNLFAKLFLKKNLFVNNEQISNTLIIDNINKVKELQKNGKNTESMLLLGNVYIAYYENIHSKLKQTLKYDWLREDDLKICFKNLARYINLDPEFEIELGDRIDMKGLFYRHQTNNYGVIDIRGRADCIDSESLFEFKCVSTLQIEHQLQLICYAWLWKKTIGVEQQMKRFILLNIRTGESKEMFYKDYEVETIMSILFDNKFLEKMTQTDEEFIKKCDKFKK
jgi:superfamily I DNA/RNA helicase